MIIIQKFNSIHEIDPEFIPDLENLLMEEIPSFKTLIQKHDSAPKENTYTYFLFFGPTQNSPIGFSELCIRTLPGDDLVGRSTKIFKFWNKEHLKWKQLTWKVAFGNQGLFVIDPRFLRSGREKMLNLIHEYEKRSDVKSEEFFYIKGQQDFTSTWSSENRWEKEKFVLEPLNKEVKDYQSYLATLLPEIKNFIKKCWKDLHQEQEINLGDYQNIKEIKGVIPLDNLSLQSWEEEGCQILTFEKNGVILACLSVQRGKNGNIFFEPFSFEATEEIIIMDELLTQYALLKFFEMPEARKCHLLKNGKKLVFEREEELIFFKEQGFKFKILTHHFNSKLPLLTHPL